MEAVVASSESERERESESERNKLDLSGEKTEHYFV